MYHKTEALTHLLYPQIVVDKKNFGHLPFDKDRMRPPLCMLRIGELFGSKDNELLGFIESLNYTFGDNTPWEIAQNMRVPKGIDINIGYKVIHKNVPSTATQIFGFDSMQFTT